MSTKGPRVISVIRNWVVPMLKSMPHRIAARLGERNRRREREDLSPLRENSNLDADGRPLLARRSLGFRTLTDMRRRALKLGK